MKLRFDSGVYGKATFLFCIGELLPVEREARSGRIMTGVPTIHMALHGLVLFNV